MKLTVVFTGESERFFDIYTHEYPRSGDEIYVDDHICEVMHLRWYATDEPRHPDVVVQETNRYIEEN